MGRWFRRVEGFVIVHPCFSGSRIKVFSRNSSRAQTAYLLLHLVGRVRRAQLRTAPQPSDQNFDNHFNRALMASNVTTQARTERGLNPGGYLVREYTFKVIRETDRV